MNCQACERPLTQYTATQVACKNGHVWTLPEYADQPAVMVELVPSKPSRHRTSGRSLPGWVPFVLAALPGVAALILEVV